MSLALGSAEEDPCQARFEVSANKKCWLVRLGREEKTCRSQGLVGSSDAGIRLNIWSQVSGLRLNGGGRHGGDICGV
jgi:hypothetical protein